MSLMHNAIDHIQAHMTFLRASLRWFERTSTRIVVDIVVDALYNHLCARFAQSSSAVTYQLGLKLKDEHDWTSI